MGNGDRPHLMMRELVPTLSRSSLLAMLLLATSCQGVRRFPAGEPAPDAAPGATWERRPFEIALAPSAGAIRSARIVVEGLTLRSTAGVWGRGL